jgi:hypothetical protein
MFPVLGLGISQAINAGSIILTVLFLIAALEAIFLFGLLEKLGAP